MSRSLANPAYLSRRSDLPRAENPKVVLNFSLDQPIYSARAASPRCSAESQSRSRKIMAQRKPFLVSLVVLALCLLASSAPAVTRGAVLPTVAEQFLLLKANQDRAARGLPRLERDPLLSAAAAAHAAEMARHADISHGFPGEPDLSERGAKTGLRFSLITENVAEASDSVIIHDLWMASPGHRANLLDPMVNVVGIAVIVSGGQIFAVEDFASTVETMSLDKQEMTVATLLAGSGLKVAQGTPRSDLLRVDARQTCTMPTGYAGARRPWYVLRYTASRLDDLPSLLKDRLNSGKYHEAVVGACEASEAGPFASYNIAVLLYP